MNKRSHFKFCPKLLYDEISNKYKNLKELRKQHQEELQNLLKNVATWMKQKCITYSINCVISKYVAEVNFRHARQYNCLLNKSNAENGIQSNPNNVVWNLSSRNVTDEDYGVLMYGLNRGLAASLSCNDEFHQKNLFGITLLETVCLKKVTILSIKPKSVREHLPSFLQIWIAKQYLKIKRNFKL